MATYKQDLRIIITKNVKDDIWQENMSRKEKLRTADFPPLQD